KRPLKLALENVPGTIPIGVTALALPKLLNTPTSSTPALMTVGFTCIVMALWRGLPATVPRHHRSLQRGRMLHCQTGGLAQVGARTRGVSRSGSTLTAALFRGFKREEAARFSFLLGLPAIALAGLKELAELRYAGLDAHGWLVLAVGLVVASLSAFVAIWG